MAYNLIIGRDKSGIKKYGEEGTILVAKQYVTMGRTTSLSNKIYMDVSSAHVVFVCGKRGSGKSYSMGAIAESAASLPSEVSQNLSFILLDTMGIYWSMRYPNVKDQDLLDQWGLQGTGLDIVIFTPTGYFQGYKDKGIPTDYPFSIRTSELNASDWFLTFGIDRNEALGVFIERIITELSKSNSNYGIEDIIKAIQQDKDEKKEIKEAALNRFKNAQEWGVFDKEGTSMEDLAIGGKVTVLDLSCYATKPNGWAIKSLVIGLISKKIFNERMIERKNEEFETIKEMTTFGNTSPKKKVNKPLTWLVLDEAHEFIPREGQTAASDALITLLREGRQPGVSLILATQQPGKIHTDVMTQADMIFAHRLTAQIDIDALKMLSSSYMNKGIDEHLRILPRVPGACLIIDDKNERMFSTRIRPRSTWHGGEAPVAIGEKKNLL